MAEFLVRLFKSFYQPIDLRSIASVVRSSAWMGIASGGVLVLGLVRSKVIALHGGASGVGEYAGLLTCITLIAGLSTLGLNISGVREIAAQGDGTCGRKRVVAAMLASVLPIALVSALLVVIGGFTAYEAVLVRSPGLFGVLLLFVCSACTAANTVYSSILQGLRATKALALATALGGGIPTIAAFSLVPFWGNSTVPVILLLGSVITFVSTAIIVKRNVECEGEKRDDSAVKLLWPLARNGIFLVGTLCVANVSAFAVRAIIASQSSTEGVGLFQAAWGVITAYSGFVITAVTADYLPKLTSVLKNESEASQVINVQVGFSVSVCIPVLLGISICGDGIVSTLYSDAFLSAVPTLEYMSAGAILRVAAWPIAHVLLADGRHRTFFLCEVAICTFQIFATWWFVRQFGLIGSGMAYALMYVVYFGALVIITRRNVKWRWMPLTRLALVASFICAAAPILFRAVDPAVRTSLVVCSAGVLAAICAFGTMWRKPAAKEI